jgi:hypothetical protein
MASNTLFKGSVQIDTSCERQNGSDGRERAKTELGVNFNTFLGQYDDDDINIQIVNTATTQTDFM